MSNEKMRGRHKGDGKNVSDRPNNAFSSFFDFKSDQEIRADKPLVDQHVNLAVRGTEDGYLYQYDNSVSLEIDSLASAGLFKAFKSDQAENHSRNGQCRQSYNTLFLRKPAGVNNSSSTLSTARSSFSQQFTKSFQDLFLSNLDGDLLAELEAEHAADAAAPPPQASQRGSYQNAQSQHNFGLENEDPSFLGPRDDDSDDGTDDGGFVSYWGRPKIADVSDGGTYDSSAWEEDIIHTGSRSKQQTLDEDRRSFQDCYLSSMFEEEETCEGQQTVFIDADWGVEGTYKEGRKRRVSFNLPCQEEWNISDERLYTFLGNLEPRDCIMDGPHDENKHNLSWDMGTIVTSSSVPAEQKISDEKKLVSALKKVSSYSFT
jgi:hypothetical protein